jgi:hypothetical protein
MTAPDTRALRELLAKATPRPWASTENDFYISGDMDADNSSAIVAVELERPDAALIVAAVNALPSLLDALGALRAERDAMRETLQRVVIGLFMGMDDATRDRLLDEARNLARTPEAGR